MKHIPLAKVVTDYDKVITCMSPSKTFNMAGLMLANVIIPNKELFAKWKDRHYDFENPLSVTAVQAAYAYGEGWLDEMKLYLDSNFEFLKQYLAKHLSLAKFRIPEATYLAWVDISAYIDTDQNIPLFFANNAGVLLEGGNMFVQNSNGFIRLNLACPRSILQIGLDRITAALKKENE
ncbi:aminotransferase, class I and II [Clostridium carboxidivorans P7]|uniref:cysteine-S-conjugate beta-lyase n=2 Tax=Clostridium TaxID=1485 RepID=C6PX49_9CLOT|nr:aminotransferase, class I and II [Clostridium carboxidivorans P7]